MGLNELYFYSYRRNGTALFYHPFCQKWTLYHETKCYNDLYFFKPTQKTETLYVIFSKPTFVEMEQSKT